MSKIKDIYSTGVNGYGLSSFYSLPVNTSTRVLSRTYNTLLTDIDLVLRHVTSSSVVSTVSNLSTWTNDLVVTTGTYISATQWTGLINLIDSLDQQRYNIHPGQLATDGSCDIVYDGSVSTRSSVWGTGTLRSITMTLRAEWPRPFLANGFFNLGGDFVFSPFLPSMSYESEPVANTGTEYLFHTVRDYTVSVPASVNGVGGGVGPLYHVDYSTRPYGEARGSGSTEYFYSQLGGPGVSGTPSMVFEDPTIYGTPYQFVGLHYGDYSTKLIIGVRQGQSVPESGTTLRVYLGDSAKVFGTNYYEVSVPGRFAKYDGPTSIATLSGLGTAGWWIWQYIGQGDQGEGLYEDRLISWIDIWSGRKGPDPIGLTQAITQTQPASIKIIPVGQAGSTTAASTSTMTNAWAQMVTELRKGTAQTYSYSRDQWLASSQSTTTIFTSTYVGTNTMSVSIRADRDQGAGTSRILTFVITATNTLVGEWVTLDSAYTYTTSSQTCTNVIPVLANAYDGTSVNNSSGGGGSKFPWWIVAVGFFGSLFSVICVKLADLGLLDWDIIEGDRQFGLKLRQSDPDAIKGYHSWAWWVIEWMDGQGPDLWGLSAAAKKTLSRKWALAIAKPAALEMAYRVGHRSGQSSWAGRWVLGIGLPLNRWLGRRVQGRLKPTKTRLVMALAMFAILRLGVELLPKPKPNTQPLAIGNS